MRNKLKVLLASSEVAPLAQTGGLAEVAGSLPLALASLGIDAAVIMPAYGETLRKNTFEVIVPALSVGDGEDKKTFSVLKGRLSREVPVFLIRYDPYFDRDGGLYEKDKEPYPDNYARFAFFSRAVIEALPHLGGGLPDIVMGNDWQTGLIMPYLLEMGSGAPKGVFVIHNMGFLGLAPLESKIDIGLPESYYGTDGLEYYGLLSFLKAGIVYSRTLVTVSPTYAKEIQTPEFGHGLDGLLREHSFKLHGILNGVDYDIWNPSTDPHIPAKYSSDNFSGKKRCKEAFINTASLKSDPELPLYVMVSRLTAQKGISLLLETARDLFDTVGANLAILGTGDPWFQVQLMELTAEYPENFWIELDYNVSLAHRLVAAADFVLVPSTYEPCGLIQMYALRYGAIPIVRAVGGLNDTVRDFAGQNPEGLWDTGFKFMAFNERAFFRAVRRASELYRRKDDFLTMCKSNMREDYSWKSSALSYYSLFLNITKSA